MSRLMYCLLWQVLLVGAVIAQEEESQKKAQENLPDPRGRPKTPLVKASSARYTVWVDRDGWHLRTTAVELKTFKGTVTVKDGTFGKLRTTKLEGKGNDKWVVNEDRTELQFELLTGRNFDGFDFDVRGQDAQLEFNLLFDVQGKSLPKRIFIGPSGGHPPKVRFSFPANPKLLDDQE